MLKQTMVALAGVAAIGVGFAGNAEAGTLTFNDRTAFQSAAGSTSVEDFNSFSSDTTYAGSSLTVGAITLKGSNSNQSWNKIDVTPYEFSNFSMGDSSPVATTITGALGGGVPFTIEFDDNITAFGANFASVNNNNPFNDTTLSLQFADNTMETLALPELLDGAFYGVVSDKAFKSVSFNSQRNDGWALDNVEYATASVPEPASLLGLAAVGAVAASGVLKKKAVA
jgi:hypothetical protein